MKKILVVDDEREISRTLEFFFNGLGHKTLLAGSADEALVLINTAKPDLILLDYHLPDMTGAELIQTIRAEKINTPVILFTAVEKKFSREEIASMGADDFISKPFEIDELQRKIRKFL